MLVLININMRLTCSDVNMISHHIINMVVGLCYNVVPINILLKWSTVLMAYYNQPFFLSVHDVYLKVTLVGFSDSVASLKVPGLRAMISLQLQLLAPIQTLPLLYTLHHQYVLANTRLKHNWVCIYSIHIIIFSYSSRFATCVSYYHCCQSIKSIN